MQLEQKPLAAVDAWSSNPDLPTHSYAWKNNWQALRRKEVTITEPEEEQEPDINEGYLREIYLNRSEQDQQDW